MKRDPVFAVQLHYHQYSKNSLLPIGVTMAICLPLCRSNIQLYLVVGANSLAEISSQHNLD